MVRGSESTHGWPKEIPRPFVSRGFRQTLDRTISDVPGRLAATTRGDGRGIPGGLDGRCSSTIDSTVHVCELFRDCCAPSAASAGTNSAQPTNSSTRAETAQLSAPVKI